MNLPDVLLREIVTYLNTRSVVSCRCVHPLFRQASMYHTPNPAFITGDLQYLIASFPYIKELTLNQKRCYSEDDFTHLHSIQKLILNHHELFTVRPCYFTYLTQLTSLDLRYNISAGYNDKIFPYLTRLTEFSINENHAITDEGLRQLTNLRRLTLHNVSNITTHGITTMSHLKVLDLYKMPLITNDVFQYLPELEELHITFCSLTPQGISCTRIKKLHVLGCNNFNTLKGLEALPLQKASLNYCSFKDDDLQYIEQIKELLIYSNPYLTGEGLRYLKNVTTLSLFNMPLCEITSVHKLPMLKKLHTG